MQIFILYSSSLFCQKRKKGSISVLYSHRDESENGLKRGEKKEHNNHVLLLKVYLLLLFTLTEKCLSFLTDKYLSKIAIFYRNNTRYQRISFSVHLHNCITSIKPKEYWLSNLGLYRFLICSRKMRGRRSDDDGQLTLSKQAVTHCFLKTTTVSFLLCLPKSPYFAIPSFIFVISKDDVDGLFSEKCNLVYCPLW